MKLINKSNNNFVHNADGKVYFLAIGATLDVPEDIANIWLNLGGVEKFIDENEVKKLEEKIKKLEAEKKQKSTKTKTKKEEK